MTCGDPVAREFRCITLVASSASISSGAYTRDQLDEPPRTLEWRAWPVAQGDRVLIPPPDPGTAQTAAFVDSVPANTFYVRGTVGMSTTDGASGGKPIAYRLTLGEAWQRIRLDQHAEADVRAYLDAVFASVPPEQAEAARGLIEGRLTTQIMAGRAKGGIDFYIPAPNVGRGPLPALTIMAAEVKIPTAAVPEPADVVARVAASNPTARTGVIAGMPAVRIDRSAGVDDSAAGGPEAEGEGENDEKTASGPRHIEYVVPVAGDPDHRWLSIALTGQAGPGGDEAKVDAAVAAFDQAVAELAWE